MAVQILNKCDLIPTWATKRWVQVLSKEFPTLAFHASEETVMIVERLSILLLRCDQPLRKVSSVSIVTTVCSAAEGEEVGRHI